MHIRIQIFFHIDNSVSWITQKVDLRLRLVVDDKQRPSKNYSKILQLRDVDTNCE